MNSIVEESGTFLSPSQGKILLGVLEDVLRKRYRNKNNDIITRYQTDRRGLKATTIANIICPMVKKARRKHFHEKFDEIRGRLSSKDSANFASGVKSLLSHLLQMQFVSRADRL